MPGDTVITENRPCRKCGYELKGLRVGLQCPECGEPIKSRPKSKGAREGTMADADPAYVATLRWGFVLMSLAIMASLFGMIVRFFAYFGGPAWYWAGSSISVIASFAWCGGVLIVSRPRPEPFNSLDEPILDNARVRTLVRVCGGVWVVYTLASVAHIALLEAATNGGGNGLLQGVAAFFRVLGGLGAYLSLIPLCIYVGELAFWMSDDTGGWRLRAAAWAMAVFGTLLMLCVGLTAIGVTIVAWLAFWISIVVVVAAVSFAWSVVQCAGLASWVLRYQNQVEGRAERITERLRERVEHGGKVTGDTFCRGCGYSLRGLPNGGRCPECGESYADITPFPIFNDRPRRPEDELPLDIDESGTPQKIVPRRPSFGPLAREPDETPIPLSGEDADMPDDMQDFPEARPMPGPLAGRDEDDQSIPLADDDNEAGRG